MNYLYCNFYKYDDEKDNEYVRPTLIIQDNLNIIMKNPDSNI